MSTKSGTIHFVTAVLMLVAGRAMTADLPGPARGEAESCAGPVFSNDSACISLPAGLAAAQQRRVPRHPVAEEMEEKLARIPSIESARNVTSIEFPSRQARFVRVVIHKTSGASQPGIDELEILGPGDQENLALGQRGAIASASSVLPGYAKHAIEH